MNSSQNKSVKITLNIEIPLDGTDPRVDFSREVPSSASNANLLASNADFLASNTNLISIPTGASPAHVNLSNQICVEGQAFDNHSNPPAGVLAKIYTLAGLPSPIPSTPDSPNTSATSIDSAGNYVFNAVPLPTMSSSTYVVVTWAGFSSYPAPTFTIAQASFAASSPGPYTDCTFPDGLSLTARSVSKSMSSAAIEVMPVAWKLKPSGFSGGAVQFFNGERKLNLVNSSSQTILYCNGGDGVTTPMVQLRCSQPGTTDWELSFALGQKRATYRQSSLSLQGNSRQLFQNPTAIGFGEEDSMPAVVSIHPA